MKKVLILIFPLIVMAGCQNNKNITIRGSIKKNTREYISVSRIDVNNAELIDSVRISKGGDFKLKIKLTEPDFFQVGFSSTNFVTLLAEPGEKITLAFPDENLYASYTVTGSKGSSLVMMLDNKLLDTKRRLDSLNVIYAKASTLPGFDTVEQRITRQVVDIVKAQRRFNIEFVINNISSLASVKALYQKLNDETYVLFETRDLQYLKIVSDSLKAHYPDSRHTKALINSFEEGMRQFNALKMNQIMDTLPVAKLDPVLKDINGRKVSLSSQKGKYVLLTFWTSDSRECISENLQLKEFYRMYNRKGFEIYQISLDTDEEAWRAAVKFDELPWISTREDDPKNQRDAVLFNVKTVPANYLFDPQGNIIASNLHGKNLQIKLSQLFNN
jgi:peroxiredoxin